MAEPFGQSPVHGGDLFAASLEQRPEFIPVQTIQSRPGGQGRQHALGRLTQHLVPEAAAVQIVDVPKSVQPHQQ